MLIYILVYLAVLSSSKLIQYINPSVKGTQTTNLSTATYNSKQSFELQEKLLSSLLNETKILVFLVMEPLEYL